MTDNIRDTLAQWTEEALDLRHGEHNDPLGKVSLPPFEAGQSAAVDMLQRVRVRLDRVEELQSLARRARARVLRTKLSAEFESSVAYDQALQTNRATRVQDFVSADERRADAALATIEQKRAAHQIKLVESFADEALDVITQCYWGLEKLREDIMQMIRLQANNYLSSVETET